LKYLIVRIITFSRSGKLEKKRKITYPSELFFFSYVSLNSPYTESIRDMSNLAKHIRKRTIQTGRLFFSSSLTRDDVVKRVFNHLKADKQLSLVSDNTFYKPFRAELGDIREIWYVRAKLSPFLPSPQNIQNSLHKEMQELQSTIQKQSGLIEGLSKMVEKSLKN